MDKKLLSCSCPFTWDMKDTIENCNKLSKTEDEQLESVVDEQDYFPEFLLIYHLMLAYENVMSNDSMSAIQRIRKAEDSLADIRERTSSEQVKKVLQHIFVATKFTVLYKLGQPTGSMNQVLGEICDVEDMNETELAMLNGCQCLAWSFYRVTDNFKAINCAERAIELDPGNGKWQYLLGKNYRRLRRMQTFSQLPDEKETSAFNKAYMLSQNVLFGTSLAVLYRESGDHVMSIKIYKEVYALHPTSSTIQLQLALGFIRAKECKLAENCLDFVRQKNPDSVRYTHYMGIYEEKCNRNSKAALPYYKSTTEKFNFGAEWQYMKCKNKVDPKWDPLPYMLTLIKKYEKNSNYDIQGINIEIGLYYLFIKNDILSACQYLADAIKLQPDARQLQKYFPLFRRPLGGINIYEALTHKIEFALSNASRRYEVNKIAMLKNTLQLCRENYEGYSLGTDPQLHTHQTTTRKSIKEMNPEVFEVN